jgi:hypothetical protein
VDKSLAMDRQAAVRVESEYGINIGASDALISSGARRFVPVPQHLPQCLGPLGDACVCETLNAFCRWGPSAPHRGLRGKGVSVFGH